MSKNICIYHGGCDDGFGAAFVVHQCYGDNDWEYYPGVYSKEPPDVTGKHVLLVDFSYKRQVLEKMLEVCESMVILDHHKTAREDLESLTGHPKLKLVFDMERSGAGITWDCFYGPNSRPLFIDYLEDRDLWRKKLPDSDLFTIALRSYPQDFSTWYHLMENMSNLFEEGVAIDRYYKQRVKEFKANSYMAVLADHFIMISNSPYFAASEVAGDLAGYAGVKFGVCYYERKDGKWVYSLRSRDDFDVSEVAKKFGGGGHKNAAGFEADRPVHTRV